MSPVSEFTFMRSSPMRSRDRRKLASRTLLSLAALILAGCDDGEAPRNESSGDAVRWTTSECEFSIAFPEAPEETSREVAGFGRYQSAQINSGKFAFRSDCGAIPPNIKAALIADTSAALREVVAEQARRSGIEPVDVELVERAGITVGHGTGSKQVEGRQVTYRFAVALGQRTVMGAMIAAHSSEFPGPAQMRFIDSLKPK